MTGDADNFYALHSCPRDEANLSTQKLQGLSVGLCQKCSGLWLPPAVRATVVGRVVSPTFPKGAPPARLRCPADASMLVALYHRGVEIDLCTTCGGIWLDAGESERILNRRLARGQRPRDYGTLNAAGEIATSSDAILGVGKVAGEAISAVLQFVAEALSGL